MTMHLCMTCLDSMIACSPKSSAPCRAAAACIVLPSCMNVAGLGTAAAGWNRLCSPAASASMGVPAHSSSSHAGFTHAHDNAGSLCASKCSRYAGMLPRYLYLICMSVDMHCLHVPGLPAACGYAASQMGTSRQCSTWAVCDSPQS